MKNQIKSILQSLGILNFAMQSYAKIRFMPYKNRKTWELHIGKLKLIYDTADAYSRSWFYPRYGNDAIHEPIASQLFIDYIKEDDIVLDVGAHLGYFSCIAAKLSKNGKTHAFDVDSKSCNLISKNASINNLENLEIHNFALSNKNEIVKIKKLESPNPGLVINSSKEQDYIEVKSITIDDFVLEKKIVPNFIKIDVEGAEAMVLSGMKNTLKLDNLIMLVEIHVTHLKKYFNTDYRNIIDLLLDNNFIVENIDHRLSDSSFTKVDKNTKLDGNTMLLCRKKPNIKD